MKRTIWRLAVLGLTLFVISCNKKDKEPEKPVIQEEMLVGRWDIMFDGIDDNEDGILDENEKLSPLNNLSYVLESNKEGLEAYDLDNQPMPDYDCTWSLEGDKLTLHWKTKISLRSHFIVEHVDANTLQWRILSDNPDAIYTWAIFKKH